MLTDKEKVLMIPKIEAIFDVSLEGMTDKEKNDKVGELMNGATEQQRIDFSQALGKIRDSLATVDVRSLITSLEGRVHALEVKSGNVSVHTPNSMPALPAFEKHNPDSMPALPAYGGYRKKSRKSKRKSKARKSRR
jgi:hypothetical protein